MELGSPAWLCLAGSGCAGPEVVGVAGFFGDEQAVVRIVVFQDTCSHGEGRSVFSCRGSHAGGPVLIVKHSLRFSGYEIHGPFQSLAIGDGIFVGKTKSTMVAVVCQLVEHSSDRNSNRLTSSHYCAPRMPYSASKITH